MVLLGMFLFFPGLVAAAEQGEGDSVEETMLMFVGESAPVVTVASSYPESAAAAPAMVTVVGREEIERHGYRTLAELLAGQPGFFMAAGGRGTVAYMRGMRDAVLFLYDGVPLTTDVTKGFSPLDREISLAGVDHIEIVRGPGSILWGPDAFAGVVNIVPLRGRQQPGGKMALSAGTEPSQAATLTWGGQGRQWDAFLALSGDRARYFSPDFTVQQSGGANASDTVAPSGYQELVGTVNYGYKMLMAVALIPLIYLGRGLIERYLGSATAAALKGEAATAGGAERSETATRLCRTH